MFIEGQLMEDVFKTTMLLPPPATPIPSPTPLPTVKPVHPHVHTELAGEVGHRTLWVVCVIMGITSIVFYAMAWRVPVQKRLFHVVTALITTFAFLSYFAMATGDGANFHVTARTETSQHIVTEIWRREIYWARYVDWALTTPLLLLDLSFLAGINGASILVAVVADVTMVLTGLFASYGKIGSQRWGWYAIACIAYLVVVYQVGFKGRRAVAGKEVRTKALFGSLAGFTLLLWTIYPIIWAVGDGARILSVDQEIIAYAVLDILAKVGFGFWLLIAHDSMARSLPSLEGFWTHGLAAEGLLRVGDEDGA